MLERFEKFTFLEVRIGTGRTHQIRVHLASSGIPSRATACTAAPAGRSAIFLHAWRIGFTSPATGERVTVEAPLPAELERLAGSRMRHV